MVNFSLIVLTNIPKVQFSKVNVMPSYATDIAGPFTKFFNFFVFPPFTDCIEAPRRYSRCFPFPTAFLILFQISTTPAFLTAITLRI